MEAAMSEKIRIAIVGYGNVGKFAVEATQAAPDMELVGVVQQPFSESSRRLLAARGIPMVNSLQELTGVQVALLSRRLAYSDVGSGSALSMGINTVDCYDIHDQLAELRLELQEVAMTNHAVAVVSADGIRGLIP